MAHPSDGRPPEHKSMADRLDWITPTAVPARSAGSLSSIPAERSMSLPYKPRLAPLLLAILFFGFGGWFMSDTADTNDRGLILEHMIHLTPEGATLFYRGVAWVSFAFVATAVVLGIPQVFLKRRLVLEEDAVLVPRGLWSAKHLRVPLASIRDVRVATYRNKYHFITLYHDHGKCKINGSLLPGVDDYQIVLDWITGGLAR